MKLQKRHGGKEIIAEMGLAVIGIAIIILFRTSLGELVSTLMSSAVSQISNLFSM